MTVAPRNNAALALCLGGVAFTGEVLLTPFVQRAPVTAWGSVVILLHNVSKVRHGFWIARPSVFTLIVKRFVGRGRPMHYDQTGLFGFRLNWWDWSYQSFPSGHATTAFALAAVIGFVSPRWF